MVDRSRRKTERTSADSDASRQRILDATIEIAAQRGYEGTTISLVSERSGLPTGSIYWHFGSKDGLLQAVIERSYQSWRQTADESPPHTAGWLPPTTSRLAEVLTGTVRRDPEFLRLGLMLALERRPLEASARESFLRFRGESLEALVTMFSVALGDHEPPMDEAACRNLAHLTVAVTDGLFVAHQVSPEAFDLPLVVDLFVRALGLLLTQTPADPADPADP